MDESMEEGDSLFSLPGPTNARALYHTPVQQPSQQPIGLGLHPHLVPQHLPELDESADYPNQWGGASSPVGEGDASASYEYEGASGIPVEEGEEEEGEGEESYAQSESSSADYDADADPEAFARRLDELAGVLEVGEEEARALRWGPAMGRERDAPDLPLSQFKALINHHLKSTEWKYATPSTLFAPVPGRSTAGLSLGGGLSFETGDACLIRVLGRGWVDRDEALEAELSGEFEGGLLARQ
ncbi:hypothetical protein CI109_106452 [Kwoniella shandongensis]|uniref:Uncharacterized protein n=1 Tax=Kwoniella shandongensis TaxID=1734106 RepID=A0A5M6C173_9TREE|nr:uncharacterized protein CI109_002634 [Kwoniella shandongensis]KAA5528877.1 hypothetical protein CI109_002634 [Kwoniella shandongensis]